MDADYDCGYHPTTNAAPKPVGAKTKENDCGYHPTTNAAPKPRKRKCKVHSGFKWDWEATRDKVLALRPLHAYMSLYTSRYIFF